MHFPIRILVLLATHRAPLFLALARTVNVAPQTISKSVIDW